LGSLKRYLRKLGPGLITGASDDDPSGIGTYSVAGASLGYSTLWMALFTLPLMSAVQLICARVGMVSGRGIASVVRRRYGLAVLLPMVLALTVANTINAGADLGAIASALALLAPIPPALSVVPISLTLVALQVWGSYRLIASVFRWLTLTLLAYIGSALFAHPDALAVVKATFVPHLELSKPFLATVVAILGTTISPYLFFWQADQEVEEETAKGRHWVWQRKGATRDELSRSKTDVYTGMLLSQVVMYFIILSTAATLHQAGKTSIQSATQAAEALRPLAGEWARALLALGLIGAGFLAVPILTGSAAYAVSEALGWRCGLDERPSRAQGFYAVIVGSTAVGALLNYAGVNPMTALFWTAVLNGLVAPPLLVVIMLLARDEKVMGRQVNTRPLNVLGWLTTGLMFMAAIGLAVTWR
jgi:NRAMP (natural resistance-associated macrophage protein)-like metal ion transporter